MKHKRNMKPVFLTDKKHVYTVNKYDGICEVTGRLVQIGKGKAVLTNSGWVTYSNEGYEQTYGRTNANL